MAVRVCCAATCSYVMDNYVLSESDDGGGEEDDDSMASHRLKSFSPLMASSFTESVLASFLLFRVTILGCECNIGN